MGSLRRRRARLLLIKRPSSAQRLYGYKWRKARDAYLKQHPYCTHCMQQGHITLATVVDHIERHMGDLIKFWDKNNWQPLCEHHHNIKSAHEKAGSTPKPAIGQDGWPVGDD